MKAGIYYACYGSWAYALQRAGFEVAWQFSPDIKDPKKPDAYASEVLRRNLPDIPQAANGDVDIICGSPPCIGMTNANPKANADHWANSNFAGFFRKVGELKPKYFLVEIVPQIFTRGAEVLKEAKSYISDYFVVWKLFRIEDYGSPSRRKRVYFFGRRLNPFDANILDCLPTKPKVSVFDAIEPMREKFDNFAPDRQILYPIYRCDGKLLCGSFNSLSRRRLNPDKPAFAITSYAYRDMQHYSQSVKPFRLLAMPEVSTLMGLPENYIFDIGASKNPQVHCRTIASGVQVDFTAYLLKYLKAWIEAEEK
jgi:site-specific DNA-cytosine methylase